MEASRTGISLSRFSFSNLKRIKEDPWLSIRLWNLIDIKILICDSLVLLPLATGWGISADITMSLI